MEKVAIVGSRWGADLAAVAAYVRGLPLGTIVISGGADGVDKTAEMTARQLGLQVWSLRPVENKDVRPKCWDVWSVIYMPGRLPEGNKVEWASGWPNLSQAAFFRDWMIAGECDRLMAFFRPGKSRGAEMTHTLAFDAGKPVDQHEVVLPYVEV